MSSTGLLSTKNAIRSHARSGAVYIHKGDLLAYLRDEIKDLEELAGEGARYAEVVRAIFRNVERVR